MSDAEQDTSAKETKPTAGDSEHINIKVADSEGGETFFKIKQSTKLGKLMSAYAERTGKDASTVRFTYDGERIEKGSTPKDLDMEDNDTIEVHIEQVGGQL